MSEFIAHIREDGTEQSVLEHSAATAALAQQYAESIGMGAMAYLQGIVHDLGKLTVECSEYIKGNSNKRRGEIDHSFAGARYICEVAKKTENPKLIDTARFIARTVVSHHGLHDWVDDKSQRYLLQRIAKADRYDEILSNIPQIITEEELLQLLEKASDEYAVVRRKIFQLSEKSRERFAFYAGMMERLMQSVLIDADRTDTASFMSTRSTEAYCDTEKLWEEMNRRMEDKCNAFRSKTDAISKQRMSISDRCAAFADHPIGACRLIVPTGGGKTLSSLRLAIRYCRKYKMERIVYIAPFMTILEQNSEEIRSIAGEGYFLEHHSNIQQEIDDAEELAAYELRADHWDLPIISTTLVQFLNTLFSGKSTSVRRMHRLSRSVIIIDEVQSIPIKCVSLFNLAVNFLTRICGSAVILCSATQPRFEETEYPLLVDEQESVTGDYAQDFVRFKRTELLGALREAGYSFEEASDFCVKKFEENGNLLVVVNTKNSASKLYDKIRARVGAEVTVIHLSTNMCPKHRSETIDIMKESLSGHKPIVCITTQLIEAGIDISFNCVVRSLAGMDNAAQAAGRCNRHGKREISPVYIINLSEERLGRLQEIEHAQKISRQLIMSENYNDLLAPDVMTAYFRKYYQERRKFLNYQVEDLGAETTLIDLLALNKNRTESSDNDDPYSRQAFATAGRLFEVIDSQTEDIIVPYNAEAEELIQNLNNAKTPGEIAALLRKAQKYTVQIFPHLKTSLNEKGARYELNCGDVAALKKEFYDPAFGIRTDADQPELFIL